MKTKVKPIKNLALIKKQKKKKTIGKKAKKTDKPTKDTVLVPPITQESPAQLPAKVDTAVKTEIIQGSSATEEQTKPLTVKRQKFLGTSEFEDKTSNQLSRTKSDGVSIQVDIKTHTEESMSVTGKRSYKDMIKSHQSAPSLKDEEQPVVQQVVLPIDEEDAEEKSYTKLYLDAEFPVTEDAIALAVEYLQSPPVPKVRNRNSERDWVKFFQTHFKDREILNEPKIAYNFKKNNFEYHLMKIINDRHDGASTIKSDQAALVHTIVYAPESAVALNKLLFEENRQGQRTRVTGLLRLRQLLHEHSGVQICPECGTLNSHGRGQHKDQCWEKHKPTGYDFLKFYKKYICLICFFMHVSSVVLSCHYACHYKYDILFFGLHPRVLLRWDKQYAQKDDFKNALQDLGIEYQAPAGHHGLLRSKEAHKLKGLVREDSFSDLKPIAKEIYVNVEKPQSKDQQVATEQIDTTSSQHKSAFTDNNQYLNLYSTKLTKTTVGIENVSLLHQCANDETEMFAASFAQTLVLKYTNNFISMMKGGIAQFQNSLGIAMYLSAVDILPYRITELLCYPWGYEVRTDLKILPCVRVATPQSKQALGENKISGKFYSLYKEANRTMQSAFNVDILVPEIWRPVYWMRAPDTQNGNRWTFIGLHTFYLLDLRLYPKVRRINIFEGNEHKRHWTKEQVKLDCMHMVLALFCMGAARVIYRSLDVLRDTTMCSMWDRKFYKPSLQTAFKLFIIYYAKWANPVGFINALFQEPEGPFHQNGCYGDQHKLTETTLSQLHDWGRELHAQMRRNEKKDKKNDTRNDASESEFDFQKIKNGERVDIKSGFVTGVGAEKAQTLDDRWSDMLLKWKINEDAPKKANASDILEITEADEKAMKEETPM